MYKKKEDYIATSEANIKEALERIEQSLENINTNEEWLKLLSFQAKFHHYSFNNMLMIYSQLPCATYVVGYNQWKILNRNVKKGTKSLKIFAPLLYKNKSEKVELKSEKIESIDDKYSLKGFKLVSVFDLSQTEGDDSKIPVVISGLKENTDELSQLYYTLKEKFIIEVNETPEIRSKGTYDILKKVITIRSSLSYQQKIKTLVHEFVHHIHHSSYHNKENRDLSEIIAESTTYIVCSYLGVQCDEYSIPYIKSWCKDINHLKMVGGTIQKIAGDIVTLLNEKSLETANALEQAVS